MRAVLYPIAALVLAGGAVAQDDPVALVAGAGCGACHQAEQPRMGPSWQAIADRYRGEESAAETLRDRMRAVSRGVWGEAPMPPVPPSQLTDAQLSLVLDWILDR